jgi:ribonuclease E
MRSSPSLDRGRFVLPRDLSAAVATAATLVAAVLVAGWLAGGLIAGVWSPREQAATVAGTAVTLAAPSDRNDAPRAARRRVSVSENRAPIAPPAARTRAAAVRGERGARRAPRARRRAAAAPSTPSPTVQAPAPTPVATATPVAAAAPVADAAPVETADTSTRATSETKRSSQVTTPAAPWRQPDEPERSSAGDHDQGRAWRPSRSRGQDLDADAVRPPSNHPPGHARRGGTGGPTAATPAPSPASAGDHGGADQHGHGRGGR